MGSFIVGRCNSLVFLLACCVPNLDSNLVSVRQLYDLLEELLANRRHSLIRHFIEDKPLNETSLANSYIANHHD